MDAGTVLARIDDSIYRARLDKAEAQVEQTAVGSLDPAMTAMIDMTTTLTKECRRLIVERGSSL